MTLYLTDNTTPDIVVAAKEAGVVAFKLYPAGATTNSGVSAGPAASCGVGCVSCVYRDACMHVLGRGGQTGHHGTWLAGYLGRFCLYLP